MLSYHLNPCTPEFQGEEFQLREHNALLTGGGSKRRVYAGTLGIAERVAAYGLRRWRAAY